MDPGVGSKISTYSTLKDFKDKKLQSKEIINIMQIIRMAVIEIFKEGNWIYFFSSDKCQGQE